MTNHNPPLILVADDQMPTTVMLERLFEFEGFQVKSVYDGIAAVNAAQTLIPDLILLDINMPGMNGFDVLEVLRNEEATSHIPTIMITAMGEFTDVVHGLKLGADDYMRKPFHPQELLARARSKMKARQLEESLQRRSQELEALLRVSEELSQHLDIGELLDFVLYLVLDLLPCDRAAIYRLDRGEVIDESERRKDDTKKLPPLDRDKAIQWVTEQKRPTIWHGPRNGSNSKSSSENIVIAPLQYGLEIRGALMVGGHTDYDENHMNLINGVGRQAALAMRNAELYEIQANYAQHLEDMVIERTQELESAQQMLIRSEKLASVGRLAAEIAHEIKNPLMPIQLNLERLLEDLDNDIPVDRSDIENSLESAHRIQHIVENVLGFTGKGHAAKPEYQLLNLNIVIESIIDLNHKLFQHNNIEVITSLGAIPDIHGNKYQLEQVFMNLILNANDAMIAVQDSALQLETFEEDGFVIATVQDNGTGMDEAVMSQVFEPFVTTKEDGNGLGLFVSYGIVQAHQGTMEVHSQKGKGTTFQIKLPVAK